MLRIKHASSSRVFPFDGIFFLMGTNGGYYLPGGSFVEKSRGEEDKSKLVCSYCQWKRHITDSCFELIGYPDWWEEKHGKPSPPPQTPWNRGGHAAVEVGGDGGNARLGGVQAAGAVHRRRRCSTGKHNRGSEFRRRRKWECNSRLE